MGLTWGLLSKPNTKKYSTDESNDKLNCAACSMQGWRETQEDAHNCILNYDTNTSYFAVYDGHGGVEVSEYTSRKLPDFLKSLDEYKNGNIEKALEEAFLKFDATLLFDDVSRELQKKRNIERRKNKRRRKKIQRREERIWRKEMRNKKFQEVDTYIVEEDISNLYEEATMPIEQVMQRYKLGQISSDSLIKCTENDQPLDAPSCSTSAVHIPETNIKDVSTNCSRRSKINSKDKSSNDEQSQLNESVKNKYDDSNTENKVIYDEQLQFNELVENECSSKVDSKIGSPSDSGDEKVQSNNSKVESVQTREPPESIFSTVPHENGAVIKAGKEKSKNRTQGTAELKEEVKEIVKHERSRTAKNLYKSLLVEEWAEEESEEEDESFVAPNDESSDFDEDHDNDEIAESDADFKSDEDKENEEDVNNDDDKDDSIEDKISEDNKHDGVKDKDSIEGEDSDEDEGNAVDGNDSDEGKDNNAGKDSDDDDEESLLDSKKPALDCGCTAVVAILKENTLYVANAGDSRCVVCRNGNAIEMSIDHKPGNKIESTRIENAGGYVSFDGRVKGGLNLSRALGDHSCKQNKDLSDREQMITALPDVKILQINPEEDEFVIVACDGIWNSMSSQECVDFVKSRLNEGREKLSLIFEEMFDHILSPNTLSEGCDNMTAILVQFKFRNSQKRPSSGSEESRSHKTIKTEHGKAST